MGFFDKLKPNTTLVLTRSQQELWPEKLLKHQQLIKEHEQFVKTFSKAQQQLKAQLEKITVEKDSIPERVANITSQHVKVLSEYMLPVFEITFTQPILFQDEISTSLTQLDSFKEKSMKNYSALKEFYEEELAQLTAHIQKCEDLLINATRVFDEKKYGEILALKQLIKQLGKEETKQEKYEKTLTKYLEQQKFCVQKKEKHKQRILQQQALVRGETSLDALKKIKEIEEQAHDIKSFYERLIFDVKHYLLKNSLTLNEETKNLFTTLKKDPERAIQQPEQLMKEFKELHETLESLEREDKKNVLGRLETAKNQLPKDARTLEEHTKILHGLKKQVMSDIAALNIYEQEQFLLRVRREESEIEEKIDFINEIITELKVDDYREQLHDLLRNFDVLIREE